MYLLLALSIATAAPHRLVLDQPLPEVVSADLYDQLLERASAQAPAGTSSLQVVAPDASGRLHLVRPAIAPPVPQKDDDLWRSSTNPVDLPGETRGALSGKAIYLSQSHGFLWFETLDGWSTQRGNLFDTVEDFHNPEGMNQFLARYLENAGARVYMARERDMNTSMAIADNDGSGYSESGSGFTDGPAGFAPTQTSWAYGDNPFQAGTTRRFPADGGAVASWSPTVPADDWYAVYVSWDSDPGNATDAHYRFVHPGGTINRRYDQTRHGSTWQYAETLWLTAGQSLTVELIGDSASGMLSADAVRIGGGMGDVSRHGETTGEPRWSSAAIYYIQYNGAPSSVYDPYSDGDGSDPTSRSRWAAWEHPSSEDAVYLSWHSNAANGAARGTVTYWAGSECSSAAVTGSHDLSSAIQSEMIDSFRTFWDASWQDRGLATACFSEVSPSNNPEMPSSLVELAFHDNLEDTLHLKHPQFRRDASRAMYRGIVRYFAERDGQSPSYAPEPPGFVRLTHNSGGKLEASWQQGSVGAPYGSGADSYLLFTSPDGMAWGGGTKVNGLSAVLDTRPGETVFMRVAAKNSGGVSFPSAVVGARRSPDGWAPVLVVDAFDRQDVGTLVETSTRVGTVQRMDLRFMNRYDIVVPHGNAISQAGWYFDSASDEAAEQLDLSAYAMVVWATGEESTNDESFSDAQQLLIRDYLAGGGTLWTSGAEMFWDLDEQGSASDQSFAADILGADFNTDAATSHQVLGLDVLAGVGAMDFGITMGGSYPVEWPDTLSSSRTVIAQYGSGELAGVLGDGVASFGFPFDAIADPLVRTEVAAALLPALVPDYLPPDPNDFESGGTGLGPQLDDDDIFSANAKRELISGGCGCGHAGGVSMLWLLIPLFLRRRR